VPGSQKLQNDGLTQSVNVVYHEQFCDCSSNFKLTKACSAQTK